MFAFLTVKWRLTFALVVTVIVFVTSLHSQDQPTPTSRLSVAIKAKNTIVKVGSPVWIDITEKNISDQIVPVGRERPVEMDQGGITFIVDVVDENGSRLAETSFYRRRLGHLTPEEKAAQSPDQLQMSRGTAILLQPGESTTNRIDISRLYDLSRPGTYFVRLPYLHSNTVQITITR
jgi:hypothetical protein